jgi:hypothetical protein
MTESIGEYLDNYMSEISTTLGITNLASDIPDTVIAETIEAYGVATEAECTDTFRLHAIARKEVWKLCLRIPKLSDGIYELIRENLTMAQNEVNKSFTNRVGEVIMEQNPYVFPRYQGR